MDWRAESRPAGAVHVPPSFGSRASDDAAVAIGVEHTVVLVGLVGSELPDGLVVELGGGAEDFDDLLEAGHDFGVACRKRCQYGSSVTCHKPRSGRELEKVSAVLELLEGVLLEGNRHVARLLICALGFVDLVHS